MNKAKSDFLPFAVPLIEQEEIDEVVSCLKSGWITTGPKTQQFEKEFSEFVGSRFAIAVNSATAGLHLGVESAGVGPGDKVITTPYTFTATAEVVRYMGADPVFVDIEYDSMNIDPAGIESSLASEPDVKAIIPVHFAGQAADMDPILSLAATHGCSVIEDAAHAFPATYKGRNVGTLGEITVFSFYATKTITTGEGGMVTTDDPAIAERVKTMRLHGISKDVFNRYVSDKPSWHYEVIAPGYKYNMSDIAAAIGVCQLQKAERFRLARVSIAERYDEAFADLPVTLPHVVRDEDKHARHLYVLRLRLDELAIDRNRFIELMSEHGVGTSVHFIPLFLHPYWRDRYELREEDFPNSTKAYYEAVSLPIYPGMGEPDCDKVINAVHKILTENRA